MRGQRSAQTRRHALVKQQAHRLPVVPAPLGGRLRLARRIPMESPPEILPATKTLQGSRKGSCPATRVPVKQSAPLMISGSRLTRDASMVTSIGQLTRELAAAL
jgi:hypothetical protein